MWSSYKRAMRGHHILAGLTGSGAGVAGHRRKGSIGPVEIDLRAGLPVWKVMTGMQGRDTFLRQEGIGPGRRNLTTRLYIFENTQVMRVRDTRLRKGSVSPVGIDWKEGLLIW
ncbi:hypothetical protein ElyMa_006271700 [Elysia marginata]|uniref:Uncharacterized protein n=1 Tax=Elysia marginata TaxID=1093978 RepID=A0AAV4HE49_9GAST|nr:hypothetical protein ElyMa_006271700 [Elysia marginata]